MLYRNYSSPSLFKPLSVFFLCLAIAGSMSRDVKKAAPPVDETVNKNTNVALIRQDKIIETKPQITQKKKKIPEKRTTEIVKTDAPAPPPPPEPAPAREPQNYENMVVASYVACNQETIEFCLIEAPVSGGRISGNAENGDVSHPYIPGSTFYFPGHEISGVENGKITVQL